MVPQAPLTEDEIFLTALLVIGPWDWKEGQVVFLLDAYKALLGRTPEITESMDLINRYRTYCGTPKKVIDTHAVGP